MKKLNAIVVAVCLLDLFLLAVAREASAGGYSARNDLEVRSRTLGMGVERVFLIEREDGPGREAVRQLLNERFATVKNGGITTSADVGSEVDTSDDGKRLLVRTPKWHYRIYGDGTRIRYRNYGYFYENLETTKNGVPLCDEELAILGLEFIHANLAGIVELGENEELVPFNTVTRIGKEYDGQNEYSYTEAKTVVFSRRVNGVDIIGAGSKIAIMYDNAGRPFGFDVDWPTYKKLESTQEVISKAEIDERVKELASIDPDEAGVEVRHFHCGYFDPGLKYKDPSSVVQSGCYIQATKRSNIDGESILSAHGDAIPAGRKVFNNRHWPQANTLSENSTE